MSDAPQPSSSAPTRKTTYLEETRAKIRRHLQEAENLQRASTNRAIQRMKMELERRKAASDVRKQDDIRDLYRTWQSEPMVYLPRGFKTSDF